ncbi:hypothetical protein ACFX2J_024313 [Malus domestica]
MSLRSLPSKPKILHSIFHSLLSPSKSNAHRHPFSSLTHHNPPSPQSPHLVSEFSRILSNHRNPHHNLELSLNALSTQISTDLVEQEAATRKRTRRKVANGRCRGEEATWKKMRRKVAKGRC